MMIQSFVQQMLTKGNGSSALVPSLILISIDRCSSTLSSFVQTYSLLGNDFQVASSLLLNIDHLLKFQVFF